MDRQAQDSTADLLGQYVLGNYGRFPVSFVRGENAQLWSETGERYLDFGAGIAVCSLGHCVPAVTEAIRAQAGRLIHCSNLYQVREQGLLAKHLVEKIVGRPGKVFFCNSGAEANEALFKLARKYGHSARGQGRTEIVTFEGSFHGRTMAGISATAQAKVKEGFQPLVPGFVHVPFHDLAALDAAVGPKTAAVLLEPVQGEGGIRPFSPEFLRETRRLCQERGALLLVDEIQSGLGRLGALCGWRAIAGPDVAEPHAVSWAKGLGGGFPIGAVWISDDEGLSGVLGPGSHGCTFGGNPLACAAALAVLQEIETKSLDQRARVLGERIIREITGWQSPLISGVRGLGLMLGIALSPAVAEGLRRMGRELAPSRFVTAELMKSGLLTVPAGTEVIRLLPPLSVTDAELDEALGILRSAFCQKLGQALSA